MSTIFKEVEEQTKKYKLGIEPFALGGGSMLVTTSSGYTLGPTVGVIYKGFSSNAVGAYTVASLEEIPSEPKRYPRRVIRELEKLAEGPLDAAAPEGETEFMDWLNSD